MPARPRGAGNVVAVPAMNRGRSRQSGNRGSRLPPLPRPGAPPVPGSPLLGAPRYWSDSYESYEPAKAADPHDAATRPCNGDDGNSRRAPEEPGCSRCTAAGAPRSDDAALGVGVKAPPTWITLFYIEAWLPGRADQDQRSRHVVTHHDAPTARRDTLSESDPSEPPPRKEPTRRSRTR